MDSKFGISTKKMYKIAIDGFFTTNLTSFATQCNVMRIWHLFLVFWPTWCGLGEAKNWVSSKMDSKFGISTKNMYTKAIYGFFTTNLTSFPTQRKVMWIWHFFGILANLVWSVEGQKLSFIKNGLQIQNQHQKYVYKFISP